MLATTTCALPSRTSVFPNVASTPSPTTISARVVTRSATTAPRSAPGTKRPNDSVCPAPVRITCCLTRSASIRMARIHLARAIGHHSTPPEMEPTRRVPGRAAIWPTRRLPPNRRPTLLAMRTTPSTPPPRPGAAPSGAAVATAKAPSRRREAAPVVGDGAVTATGIGSAVRRRGGFASSRAGSVWSAGGATDRSAGTGGGAGLAGGPALAGGRVASSEGAGGMGEAVAGTDSWGHIDAAARPIVRPRWTSVSVGENASTRAVQRLLLATCTRSNA